jgi:hypothetical protein
MHAEDAFAALRIPNYRNFLRMKFEPDKVTIYPLGLDKIPRRDQWIDGKAAPPLPNNPQIALSRPLNVKLIEEPIVIYSASQYRS